MSSSTRSWRQKVSEADPDYLGIENRRPVIYIFSSGRKFRSPVDPYQGGRAFTLDETPLNDPVEVLA